MLNVKCVGIVTVVLILFTLDCHGALDRAEYGEECNASRKCNRRAFLWCNSTGVCGCSKPQSMLFDATAAGGGKCLLKTGEVCKVPLGEDDGGKPTFQTLPCVGNSSCSSEGFCVCNSGFFENVQGTCDAMRIYLEDCSGEKLCNWDLGLLCATNGTCVCNQGTEYMPGKGCLGLPGKACNRNGTTLGCFYSSTSCINGSCQCSSSEMYLDSEGCHAKKGLSSTCKSDDECGEDTVTGTKLVCSGGICNCDSKTSVLADVQQYKYNRYSQRSVLADFKKMCAPKYNEPCFQGYCSPGTKCEKAFDPIDQKYTSGARSVKTSVAFCKCPSEMTWSAPSNSCLVPHGGTCSSDSPCHSNLACKRSTCSCPFAELEYNSAREKCVSHVGGPCETVYDCKSSLKCIGGVQNSVPGECACMTGYVETTDRVCTKTAGMRCSEDSECDPLADLECSNQKCECRNRAEYSETERRCMGYVGTPCENNNDCVETAECFRSHKTLKAVCRCRPGFFKTSNLTCILDSDIMATKPTTLANPETSTTTTAQVVTDENSTTETIRETAESHM